MACRHGKADEKMHDYHRPYYAAWLPVLLGFCTGS
jgi:hypothetical protein